MARKLISSGSDFEKKVGYSRAVVDGDWVFVSGKDKTMRYNDFSEPGGPQDEN